MSFLHSTSSSQRVPAKSRRRWHGWLSISIGVCWLWSTVVLPPASEALPTQSERESQRRGAGFVINGSNSTDSSGYSVSDAGDVNGDGLADVIVGAPFADPNGRADAGLSYVVFGKRNRQPVDLSALESGSSLDGFVIVGSDDNDQAGISVSGAGDVNGDGLADVIVGARLAYLNNSVGVGLSYVVFGKRDRQPVDLSALESGSSTDGFVINNSAEDRSGLSVGRAGDVNGDGLTDVIVGTYGASPNGRSLAGRSYVVFGKGNGQTVELSALESGSSPNGFVINGSKDGDFSGRSVSGAGDVNGDGLADVIVGAYNAEFNSQSYAGRSYVVFGKGNSQIVELSTIESASSREGFVINGSKDGDGSGLSVNGAGDVNGDGLADVIVGAFNATPNGQSSAGRSYVVFGKSSSRPVELSTLESASSREGFVINGSHAGDNSGFSVSGAGDVNGDGLSDLIVGARTADPNGQSNAGRSYVVFGKVNSRPVELSTLESASSREGFVINGSRAGDNSGFSVSGAGDVNGDGLSDLIVGAYNADFNSQSSAGRNYVIFGKRNRLPVGLADLE